jgi:PHP family Zn ribbon phosphoesterase
MHSALSPCGAKDMAPAAVARALAGAGVGIAALTDHNSCRNSAVFAAAFAASGIAALYGMELETSEEVHVLCLFRDRRSAEAWQSIVEAEMPDVGRRGFGEQIVFDEQGRVRCVVERLLSVATGITLDRAAHEVKARGGLCIPAHINRPAYGLLGVLGMVPPGLSVPALEISPRASEAELRGRHGLSGYRVVSFSDAHCLEQIQPARTAMLLAEPTFDEVAMALSGEQGRRVVVFE